ncbi:hypothetical protein ATL39_2469 [Sinobaca qinghaiensis]|uniref:Uncharacterized protein n=1 Tax=Sinobaca qinghaiensis TaxID=342944 RepID=A0A419UZI0_9BACL|nr:hypothetical protein [Sinobaca qinghaiensis]RKD71079.1 hypothetical protein ATL39_2469 [Sinobaca qinghaiensis]
MLLLTLAFLILLPVTIASITIVVSLIMKWLLEKEVNNRKEYSVFHFVNIAFTIMMWGTTSIVFYGLVLEKITETGWMTMTMYAYVYPLPVILLLYTAASRLFRSWIYPVSSQTDNIIYLKRRSGLFR